VGSQTSVARSSEGLAEGNVLAFDIKSAALPNAGSDLTVAIRT
jgi:hypothetical protein